MQRQIETAIAQINNAWSICVAIIYEPSRSLLVKPQYVFNLNYHQSASAVQKGSAAAAMRCVLLLPPSARERIYTHTKSARRSR
jgi:hypothetical protein